MLKLFATFLFVIGFCFHESSMAQEDVSSAEDSLLLNQPQTEDDNSDDEIDDNEDAETVYLDEFKRTEYGDKKYRVSFNAGFNAKSTITNIQGDPEHNQSESPYYRMGFVYLSKAIFPGSSFARIFSWGADVVYSKSVSSRTGVYSSTRYEERNMIFSPKVYAETPLPGLHPSVYLHFAIIFNFYIQHETRLVTPFYTTKLESPKYKKDGFSEFFVPGLEIGFRYQLDQWSLLVQGDAFQGEKNNPWGAFALTGGAVYDF